MFAAIGFAEVLRWSGLRISYNFRLDSSSHEQEKPFNKLVEATIEVYVNYLLDIFIGCGVPSNGITLEKGGRELLGQISLIVERGGQQCLGKWCFPLFWCGDKRLQLARDQ